MTFDDRDRFAAEALGWVAGGRRSTSRCWTCHMPELDGVAAGDRGPRAPSAAPPPVIISSSLGVHDRGSDAVAAFLIKPVKPRPCTTLAPLAGQAAAVRRHRRRDAATWPAPGSGSCSPRTTR